MRDLYQEGTSGGWPAVKQKLKNKPYLNPWQELAFADIKLLATSSSDGDPTTSRVSIWEPTLPRASSPSQSTGQSDVGSVGDPTPTSRPLSPEGQVQPIRKASPQLFSPPPSIGQSDGASIWEPTSPPLSPECQGQPIRRSWETASVPSSYK